MKSTSPPAWVIGTAGHIDHGKTSLVKALTGVDTDRLKEEKERGITIELGFAHLDLTAEGLGQVGVVDVPGHERFIRTMVAGAVGVDAVVLVVAADEGVMPQTREHLDVCRLLDVKRGLVALTKVDLVDRELRELAAADVAEALKGTFLEGAPIVGCSAMSGEGLAELNRTLAEVLRGAPVKDPEGLVRLPLDRVFTMKGFGTVVTGTLWAGRLRVGADVVTLPGGTTAKVRGIQVHGKSVEEARAGQRTAINLAVAREGIERGETLVLADTLRAGKLLDARLRWLSTSRQPLKRRARVLVHAGTAQSLATVTLLDRGELEPGGEALAQVHLDEPIVSLPGDRFILRGFGLQKEHRTTVGGGVVLRVLGPRHRRGTPEVVAQLKAAEQAAADPLARIDLEVQWAGVAGLTPEELGMRVPFTPRATEDALGKLLGRRRVVRFDRERGSVVHAEVLSAERARALAAVDDYHAAAPLKPGLSREELRSKLPASMSPRLFHLVVEGLVADHEIVAEKDLVRRPTHNVAASQEAQGIAPLADRLTALYHEAGVSPPRLAEAQAALKIDAQALKNACDLLVREGTLVRIQDLVFHRNAVDGLRARLMAFLREKGQITPQEWKELVGATRKYTIPLAEYFDAEKVTLRIGDLRKLRK
jgi:selenocysteine-specific elongation factor